MWNNWLFDGAYDCGLSHSLALTAYPSLSALFLSILSWLFILEWALSCCRDCWFWWCCCFFILKKVNGRVCAYKIRDIIHHVYAHTEWLVLNFNLFPVFEALLHSTFRVWHAPSDFFISVSNEKIQLYVCMQTGREKNYTNTSECSLRNMTGRKKSTSNRIIWKMVINFRHS